MNTINACWLPPALLVAVILGYLSAILIANLFGSAMFWFYNQLESRKND